MKNYNDIRIYNYVIQLASTSADKYTRVTNTKIARDLDLSVFTVRDKVIKLVKQGYLKSECDFFDSDNQYIQRRISKGEVEPSIDSNKKSC